MAGFQLSINGRFWVSTEGSEDDGVIHLRPSGARADAGNVLNRAFEKFVLRDATLQDALREIHFRLRPELRQGGIAGSGPPPTALGLIRFSIAVDTATVADVLDGIIKAHGGSSWHVTYLPDNGTAPRYRIGFDTFDGWGTTW